MNIIEFYQADDFRITSDPRKYSSGIFGKRDYTVNGHNYDSYCNGYHNAVDLSDKNGKRIKAFGDAVVIDGTRDYGTFGAQVVLMYEELGIQVIYGHVQRPISVKVGQRVKRGDVIARQGNTHNQGANVSMDSHLHLQVQHIEPLDEWAFTCKGINPFEIDIDGGNKKVGKKIALDIGHGSNSFPPSKGVYRNGRGYAEHDFNSKLGRRIKQLLELNGFDVIMAQSFNSPDVSLTRRTNYYDAQRADLGLSVHANAGAANAGGRCAFYWTTSSQGKRFATNIINNMKEMGYGIHGSGLHASTYGSWTNLHMVRESTTFPMVLVEHGFMTNSLDFPLIFGNRQDTYIEDMAEADVKAVCQYFGVSFSKGGSKPSTPSPSSGVDLYRVQVGAFGVRKNAINLESEIKGKGYSTYLAYDNEDDLYRVQVGAFGERSNADNQLKDLQSDGYKDAFIATHDGHVVSDGDSDADETESPKELTGGVSNIQYLEDTWNYNNSTNAHWVKVDAEFIVGDEPIYVYDHAPKIIRSNRARSQAKAGAKIKVLELARADGHVWAGYRTGSGLFRYMPIKEWNGGGGRVTNSGLWGRFV